MGWGTLSVVGGIVLGHGGWLGEGSCRSKVGVGEGWCSMHGVEQGWNKSRVHHWHPLGEGGKKMDGGIDKEWLLVGLHTEVCFLVDNCTEGWL